jgi:hypothetical protein
VQALPEVLGGAFCSTRMVLDLHIPVHNAMNLNVLLTLWSGLLLATVAVSVLRWNAGQKEDDHLHMLDDAKLISAQIATAHRLDVLDRWMRVLLVLTLLLGLAVGALHLYNVWLQATYTSL